MAEIVKITKDGVIQYPITKPEAVIDENGKNVLQLIRENGGGGGGSYDDTEIKQEIKELSDEVVLRNIGAEDVGESVEEPIIPMPNVDKEWKCVMERRMTEGEQYVTLTTFQDGTPLKATEIIVQILMDVNGKNSQGYIEVQSTSNKSMTHYGAVHFESVLTNNTPNFSQIKLTASPHTYLVAEILDKSPLVVAQGNNIWGRPGGNPQIYEDFTYIKIGPTNPYTSAAPYIKIYAR